MSAAFSNISSSQQTLTRKALDGVWGISRGSQLIDIGGSASLPLHSQCEEEEKINKLNGNAIDILSELLKN